MRLHLENPECVCADVCATPFMSRAATGIVSVVEALRIDTYPGRVGTEPGIRELIIGCTS
jgi:hypothetical protein